MESGGNWWKVAKSGEKLGKVAKSGGKVVESGEKWEKWLKVVKSGEKILWGGEFRCLTGSSLCSLLLRNYSTISPMMIPIN